MCSAGYNNNEKALDTYVFHQIGQSAKMQALQHSRKRLGFLILCKGGTATAGTEDVKCLSTITYNIYTVAKLLGTPRLTRLP